MKRSRRSYLIIVLFLMAGGNLSAQRVPNELSTQIDSVFANWTRRGMPGGAAGILQSGQLVYSRGYGLASLEYEVPNTAETIFNVASVSKQFTAFSIVLLAQQGKLSLDDDIRKYVPEVPEFGTPITIRHLVHHTSGLRNFQNLLIMAGWREGDPMSNDDLLEYLPYQRSLNFPVGSEYLYCNTGYNLMATLVERVTGQSFIEWTRANIFQPLDMMRSEFRNDMTSVQKHTATSYEGSDPENFVQPLKFWNYMGNGNLYTTVGDLAKWMDNFRTGRLGGKKAIDQMLQRGVLSNGDTIAYAFGLSHGEYRGLKIIAHGGSIGGYRSYLLYFPGQETGISVISNFSSSNIRLKALEIADIYLEKQFTEPKKEADALPEFERELHVIAPALLDDYVGQYWVNGLYVHIYRKENQLFAKAGEEPTVELMPSSDSTFFVEPLNMDVVFHRSSNGTVNRLTAYSPLPQKGKRIDPRLQKIDQLVDVVGRYYSPELRTYYSITLEKGQLLVQHPRHATFQLVPIEEDRFAGSAWFFSQIKLIRNGLGKITGLEVSNGRVRNLLFEKIDL